MTPLAGLVVAALAIGSAEGAGYQLIVRGELDQRFAHLYEPTRLERTAGTRVISGRVLHEAQLHGFIERIEDLGLGLLSVEQISEPS